MNQKQQKWPLVTGAFASLATVSAGMGILVDFRGAAEAIGAVWPVLDAAFPIIALSLITGGGAGLVIVAWQGWWRWYGPRRTSEQLKAFAWEIVALKKNLTPDGIHRMIVVLDERFKISAPQMTLDTVLVKHATDGHRWHEFLARLYPLAELGNVKAARRLWSEIEAK